MTYCLVCSPAFSRPVICAEPDLPIDACILAEVEAGSWIEAKALLGAPLTPVQESLLQASRGNSSSLY